MLVLLCLLSFVGTLHADALQSVLCDADSSASWVARARSAGCDLVLQMGDPRLREVSAVVPQEDVARLHDETTALKLVLADFRKKHG